MTSEVDNNHNTSHPTLAGTPTARRDLIAFFLFGLVNNIIYVIFLSAAADLLEKEGGIPKSSVLLADILPCLFVKLIAPYLIQIIPYPVMVSICVFSSLGSLLMVAFFDSIWWKFLGIIMASAGSGLGETCFLALTTYYNPKVIIAWSSGTGTAGILGSVYYLLVSSILRLEISTVMVIACILPLIMGFSYIFLLQPAYREESVVEAANIDEQSKSSRLSPKSPSSPSANLTFFDKIGMIRPLILRYILPLFLVYFAEYTINQSVFFSLLYPLSSTPFRKLTDHYVTYSTLYQVGVFLSRSFGRAIPISNGWVFAFLQVTMLLILTAEVIWSYIGHVYIVFFLVLFEGLLGGAAYVNTFCNITQQVEKRNLEFSMAFTGIADSSGIALAGFICRYLEPLLCSRNAICKVTRA